MPLPVRCGAREEAVGVLELSFSLGAIKLFSHTKVLGESTKTTTNPSLSGNSRRDAG
jgi:hypothetical protein